MKLQSHQNKKILHAPVTRQNYFAGLEISERVKACKNAISGEIIQFKNETAILLNLAREGFPDELVYRVEIETGVCLDLSSLDIEAQELSYAIQGMLKSI